MGRIPLEKHLCQRGARDEPDGLVSSGLNNEERIRTPQGECPNPLREFG